MEIINSILCRKRSLPILERYPRYQHFIVEKVDGKVKYTPSPVVAPAIAASSSVIMNALQNRDRVPLRSRKVVDAVDLSSELEKLK